MSRKTSKPTDSGAAFDAVWRAFHERHAEQAPPPLAISADQYAERFGVTRDQAHMRMLREERRGELQSDKFNVRDRGGKVRAIRFWWPA